MSLVRSLLVFVLCLAFVPQVLADKIDINTADKETLAVAMDNVGPKKAQAIIDYRNKHGFFKSIEELPNVKGIGPKTLERNRDKIMVVLPEKTDKSVKIPEKMTSSEDKTPTHSADSSKNAPPETSGKD